MALKPIPDEALFEARLLSAAAGPEGFAGLTTEFGCPDSVEEIVERLTRGAHMDVPVLGLALGENERFAASCWNTALKKHGLFVGVGFEQFHSYPEQEGILAHEIAHIVLGHAKGRELRYGGAKETPLSQQEHYQQELEADQLAAQMGYGNQLADALMHYTAHWPPGYREKDSPTHPPVTMRVNRLRDLARQYRAQLTRKVAA